MIKIYEPSCKRFSKLRLRRTLVHLFVKQQNNNVVNNDYCCPNFELIVAMPNNSSYLLPNER